MKSKFSLGLASGVLAAVLLVSPAFAWSFGVSALKGKCLQNGKFEITWVVNNPEREDLIVTQSSDTTLIPVGTLIHPDKRGQGTVFVQDVDGSKAGIFSLSLSGHWKHDTKDRTYANSIKLKKACDQPVVPPVDNPPVTPPNNGGGMGGGTTTPADTPAAPANEAAPAAAQVVVPAGAVNAGAGGAPRAVSLAALAGLIGSIAAVVVGMRNFKKQS